MEHSYHIVQKFRGTKPSLQDHHVNIYLRKNFRGCISTAQNDVLKISKRLNILKFVEKHSRFEEKPRKFCLSNLLYYTV